jgi:sulfite reductase alpha subunit-like flavoprotein
LPWSTRLRQRLLEEYPLPEGIDPIPDGVLLDPKWVLELAESSQQSMLKRDLQGLDTLSITNGDKVELPPPNPIEILRGLTANIISNDRITPTSHWQDVRHLKLDVGGVHPYVPGDVLTIYPKNFPVDVNHFLDIMDWTPLADMPLRFTPSSQATSPNTSLPVQYLSHNSTVTLRQLLTNHLDILAIPRRSFFAQLAHYTTDEFHRERLLEFTNPDYIDELYDYTTRPRRSILEVLQEFESVKIPWQRVCSIIPMLRGRQFSIASAMNPSNGQEPRQRTTIELLIAVVKYKTVIKRIREGVCTRYVASLTPGQQFTVTLSKGGLGVTKKEVEIPVVMIGPGTGVAPMRALIHQRMQWRKELDLSNERVVKDLLFFGCRNAESDYFFKDEWQTLIDAGVPLEVFAAFSRDQVRSPSSYFPPNYSANNPQRQKVYVQDLLRQQSSLVYNALAKQNGIVYICGSSGKMPQAVREALIEAFQTHGPMIREEAEAYLVAMEKSGRYKQETW